MWICKKCGTELFADIKVELSGEFLATLDNNGNTIIQLDTEVPSDHDDFFNENFVIENLYNEGYWCEGCKHYLKVDDIKDCAEWVE